VNNNNAVLFVIGDKNRGIIIDICNNSNGEWFSIQRTIDGDADNQFVNWTLSQLGLGVGDYRIEVKYSDNDWIFDSDFSVVDKSNFFVKADCDWLYTTEDVLRVWCPTDGEGTIEIRVNDGKPIELVITDEEKGTYIGFTLSDLGITESNWYNINVTVNGQQITDDNTGLGVPDPIEIPTTNVYLPEEGYNNDFSIRIAKLELTNNTSGNVVVTIDGIEYFNKNLENIPYYMDKSKLVYEIFTSNLNSTIDVGTHNVEVTLNDLKVNNVINFLKRNSKSQDGISIIILNGDKISYWDDVIAEIIAPNRANGRVVVKLNGTEVNSWDELGWIENERYDDDNIIYYIKTYHLNDPMLGKYTINVTYYFDDDKSISNMDDILLMGDIANQVGIWFKPEDMLINSTEDWIHLYPNGNDGRFVLTINDTVYFNKTTDKLNYNDERNYISTSELNPSIEAGTYNIRITFYSDNDYSYKTWESQVNLVETLPNLPNIFIAYTGENGEVQYTNTSEDMIHIYPNDDTTNPENIRIIVTINNTQYLNATIGELQLPQQTNLENNQPFYTLGPKHFNQPIPTGNYTNIQIQYISNNYQTQNYQPNYAEIIKTPPTPPRIFIMYCGDNEGEVQYDTERNDMIHIYPNEDNTPLENIRIVVIINNTEYLNDTIANLGLQENTNPEHQKYYTIGPVNFNQAIKPGYYENIIAYYISNNYNIGLDSGMPNYANITQANYHDGEVDIFGEGTNPIFEIDSETNITGTVIATINNVEVFNSSLDDLENHIRPNSRYIHSFNFADLKLNGETLLAGNYHIIITYNGAKGSIEKEFDMTIEDNAQDPNFKLSIDNVEEGNPVTVNVTALDRFTGDVVVTINNTQVNVHVENGFGTNTTSLAVGNYSANLEFVSSERYNLPLYYNETSDNYVYSNAFKSASTETTFNVTAKPTPQPINPNFTINIPTTFQNGTPITITITANENFTDNINITINEINYPINIIKGQGNTTIIPTLTPGTYNATINYPGNENYTKTTITSDQFTVTAKPTPQPINPNFNIIITNVEEGNPITIKVTANETFTENITVTIKGNTNTNTIINIINGEGNQTISGLTSGEYTATINYTATTNFNAETKTIQFNITKKIEPINPGNTTSNDTTTNNTHIDTPPTNPTTPTTPSTPITTTNKVTLTKTKIVKTISKNAKKLVITTTLKVNSKVAKTKKVTFIVNGKKFTSNTNKKGVVKLTIKKKALQKILKKVKAGKKIKVQIKYGKKTVTEPQ
jgi:hypothetical protein